ncbi:MAG: Spy/CpxP family protein refolding chaperone [Pseudomonadota bacterium]
MKSIRTTLIAASLLAGLSGLTLAQTAPEAKSNSPRAERMDKMLAKMGEHRAKHLTELKGKLKLDAGQESAWTAFEQSMKPPAKPMARPDRAAMEKMTTPERIDQMQAHKAERDAQMQKHADATKTFYAALNATQKKVFDAETTRAMHSGMGKMGGMGAMGGDMHGGMRHGEGQHQHH